MSRSARPRKPSWLLGLILLALLLAAVSAGGLFVVREAFGWQPFSRAAAPEPEPVPAQEPVQAAERPAPEPEAPAEPPKTVTLMALGDDLIHNCIYWSAELPEGGYDFTRFFSDIRPTVEQYDIACIHQETILVRDRALISNYPVFGTPVEIADALRETGFDVVSCAGNHCFDKGETGIRDTIETFRETCPEITLLGIHDSQADARELRIVEKNGIRIAMFNYTYGLNYAQPKNAWMVDTFSDEQAIAEDLRRAHEQADFVVVFAHWGEEDTFAPNSYQTGWAEALADAGADLIIGCHTHTLQPLGAVECAGGRTVPVFFGLGNFLSHQIEAKNMLGGMASVTICKDADGTRVESCELLPTVNVIIRDPDSGWYNYRPMLLSDYTADIAATHRVEGCSVEQMNRLYEQIVKG